MSKIRQDISQRDSQVVHQIQPDQLEVYRKLVSGVRCLGVLAMFQVQNESLLPVDLDDQSSKSQ